MGNDAISLETFTFGRQTDDPGLCLADYVTPAASGRTDYVAMMVTTIVRALRALSSCNRALAHAASEKQLLDEICDLMVRIGGYRMAGIGFAEHDERKTVRPVAHAGFVSAYLTDIDVRWSDTPQGRGPAGTAIRESGEWNLEVAPPGTVAADGCLRRVDVSAPSGGGSRFRFAS